jgi:hypothetical protein
MGGERTSVGHGLADLSGPTAKNEDHHLIPVKKPIVYIRLCFYRVGIRVDQDAHTFQIRAEVGNFEAKFARNG